MKWFTDIIHSASTDKYYVGHTHNLSLRLERHNSGNSRSTKHGIPWKLVYFEEYSWKSEAMKREYEFKKKKSRKYTEKLILNH